MYSPRIIQLTDQKPVILLVVFLWILVSAVSAQEKEMDDSFPSPFRKLYPIDPYRNNAADSLKYLIPILDSVLESDQKYRYYRPNEDKAASVARFGRHKSEVQHMDSINAEIVSGILDKYGWLGKKEIGISESSALFLVIQHAGLATQEKYLPLLKKAVLDKKESPHNLTMMEDRVSIHTQKYQLYGTQLFYYPPDKRFYLYPLLDPENIIQRRMDIGLDAASLSAYLKQFNIDWDLATYQKELPKVKKYVERMKKPS